MSTEVGNLRQEHSMPPDSLAGCSLHPMLKKWIINGTRNYSSGSIGFSAHTDLVLFPNCPNTDESKCSRPHILWSCLEVFWTSPSSFQAGFSKMPRCCFVPPASYYNAPYCSLIQITFPFGIQADTAKKQGQQSFVIKLIQIYKIKNSNKCWTPEASIMLCWLHLNKNLLRRNIFWKEY